MSTIRFAALLLPAILSINSSHAQNTSDTTVSSPNVLLVIADDMGLDASPCHGIGGNTATMPTLVSLCENGTVFDNGYAAPECSPTRATILTGRYGLRTGVGAAIPKEGGAGLSAEETSLFDVLGEAGYASALIGKWHVAGSDDPNDHPAMLGVDEYFGIFKGAVRDYYRWDAVENGTALEIEGYTTTVLTDRAAEWIAERDSPWFLWLAYNAPHTPFHLPPAELHSNTDLVDDAGAIEKNPLPYYQAALEALDTELGRLLDSLDEATRRNTVVMFVGDNGTPGQVINDVYGAQRAKGTLYEGGTHVPLVVQGPGVAMGRSEALVNTTDLFATVASLTGASAESEDSFSLTSMLDGGEGSREHVYTEYFSDQPTKGPATLGWAVRDLRYKLLALEGEDPKLFDLVEDPYEEHDLLTGTSEETIASKATALQEVRDALLR